MNDKIPVTVLGATGMVGQNYLKLLNDHPWFDGLSPTAERVARTICDRMSHDDVFGRSMCSVEVTETPGCSARYVRS